MNNEELNTVSSKGQLDFNKFVTFYQNDGVKKILFVGNSITRHAPNPTIGWHGDWGMAASCKANDYVHQTVSMLEQKLGKVDYCIAQAAEWERNLLDPDAVFEKYYTPARDFNADIVIIRIGENIKKEDIENSRASECYAKMIRFFSKNCDAQVIVTGSFWKNELRDSVILQAAKLTNSIFVSIADIEQIEGSMALGEFEHKGVAVHPSDFGMKLIAEHVVNSITI